MIRDCFYQCVSKDALIFAHFCEHHPTIGQRFIKAYIEFTHPIWFFDNVLFSVTDVDGTSSGYIKHLCRGCHSVYKPKRKEALNRSAISATYSYVDKLIYAPVMVQGPIRNPIPVSSHSTPLDDYIPISPHLPFKCE